MHSQVLVGSRFHFSVQAGSLAFKSFPSIWPHFLCYHHLVPPFRCLFTSALPVMIPPVGPSGLVLSRLGSWLGLAAAWLGLAPGRPSSPASGPAPVPLPGPLPATHCLKGPVSSGWSSLLGSPGLGFGSARLVLLPGRPFRSFRV